MITLSPHLGSVSGQREDDQERNGSRRCGRLLGVECHHPVSPCADSATDRHGEASPDSQPRPQQNMIDSKRYEQMLRTNPAFREARMQKECGGITIPELRESCLASFNQG